MTKELTVTAAENFARVTIMQLIADLQLASDYFVAGQDLAAWGTLVMFEELAENLKAAIRLHHAAIRSKP